MNKFQFEKSSNNLQYFYSDIVMALNQENRIRTIVRDFQGVCP